MPNALFIAGNKRSGTSQLVRLLNLHPHIFVSHESDAIWIIFQFLKNQDFTGYLGDSRVGLDYSLKISSQLLSKDKSAAENFFAIEQRLMEAGSPWLPPVHKQNLRWVGDKKPFQYADPMLTNFIHEHFPKVSFIHLIRHPFAVVQSAREFNKTPEGDFWQGLPPEQMLAEWTKNEQNILELKQSDWARVLDVRYEDLCRQTGRELLRIFNFLGLEADSVIVKAAVKTTYLAQKSAPIISCNSQTLAIMNWYGYRPQQAQQGRMRTALSNIYWKLRKNLYA